MGPIWPFRKKKPDRPSISRKSYMKNVVEYERKTKKEEKEKGNFDIHISMLIVRKKKLFS